MAPTTDPFRSQSFYLDLGSVFKGPILKITGLNYEREVKTVYQANKDGRTIINQLPGKYKPATITINKSVTAHKGFWDWRKKVLEMTDIAKVRQNGTITVYDFANNSATLKWHIIGAWPSRIKGPILDAKGEAVFEEIEICYEQLQQVEG